MADYKATMFIIEFVNGKMKKWDDDRFKLEIAEDGKSLKVYSRITQEVALDVPNMDNVLYIHHNIVKKALPTGNKRDKSKKYGSMVTVGDEVNMDNVQAEFASAEEE